MFFACSSATEPELLIIPPGAPAIARATHRLALARHRPSCTQAIWAVAEEHGAAERAGVSGASADCMDLACFPCYSGRDSRDRRARWRRPPSGRDGTYPTLSLFVAADLRCCRCLVRPPTITLLPALPPVARRHWSHAIRNATGLEPLVSDFCLGERSLACFAQPTCTRNFWDTGPQHGTGLQGWQLRTSRSPLGALTQATV